MTELLHQLGFRYQWNIDCFLHDQAGDGLIVAPRYMGRSFVVSMEDRLKASSIFDPQFFLPSSAKGSLSTYEFFPDVVAEGFDTADWNREVANESANRCLQFQHDQGFQYLVIPTRFREGMPQDFIKTQDRMFVRPFIHAFNESGLREPLLLQLILTDQMLKDEAYSAGILNWVTGIAEISGVYLICYHPRRRKQIDDIDFLLFMLGFVDSLNINGLRAILGYLNTEGVLLLAANPHAITMGSYENLRMFGPRPFEESPPSPTRPPNPRVYVSRLLQWIDHRYIGAILRVVGDPYGFFDDTSYLDTLLDPSYEWHFQKPEPYKHFFSAYSKQTAKLTAVHGSDRLKVVANEIQIALDEFRRLEESGIVLDEDSGGRHLAAWLTALNQSNMG